MNIMIFGLPGSGKTTQSKILAKDLGLRYISIGEITRREVFAGTEFGNEIKRYWDNEEFFPKGFLVPLIKKETKDDGYIIDGFPKTLTEYEDFIENFSTLNIDRLLVLENSTERLRERIDGRINCRYCGQPFSKDEINHDTKCICGERLFYRRDDENIFDIRCLDFEKETKSVIEELSKLFPTEFIDSTGTVAEIADTIKARITEKELISV